jgi:thiol-disulfide isomerase/thioredoxin
VIEQMCRIARAPLRSWIGARTSFAGKSHGGDLVSTEDWRGDVGVAVFWATWCRPCDAFLDTLESERARYGAEALKVLGISCDVAEIELGTQLLARPARDWPQLFDPALPGWPLMALVHDVRSIPTAFVLDRVGVVRDVVSTPKELTRALERAMAPSPR